MKTLSPTKVVLFSAVLLVLGFVIGLGYQSYQYAEQQKSSPGSTSQTPVMSNLRVSQDDRLLAFTAIYHHSSQSSRFVFDLQNSTWSAVKTPDGWQDSMVQWSNTDHTLLYQREKIPQSAAGAKAGLYREKVLLNNANPKWQSQTLLSSHLQEPGEKIYAGFWTPQGQLVVKTQHLDKSLFIAQKNQLVQIDHSPGTYYQNRAISTAGGIDYYVVRDVNRTGQKVALFRIRNKHSIQLGPDFSNVVWAYLSENAKWLLICSNTPDKQNWKWDLWQVQNNQQKNQLKKIKSALVPNDVIAVYWSPDFHHILGAVGNGLWLIDVPSLTVHRIGDRNDWNADDAAWLNHQNAVLVAAAGKLWKVDIVSGERKQLWEFPPEYWK